MTRVLPLALAGVVLAAAVAWYQGGERDDPADVAGSSAEPARDRSSDRSAQSGTPPEASGSRAPQVIAESTESPQSRAQPPVVRTADPLADPATGAVPAWRTADDDQAASSSVRLPPADSDVDPATGAPVVRQLPDDVTGAMSASGALPQDVEVDPATGVATAR